MTALKLCGRCSVQSQAIGCLGRALQVHKRDAVIEVAKRHTIACGSCCPHEGEDAALQLGF